MRILSILLATLTAITAVPLAQGKIAAAPPAPASGSKGSGNNKTPQCEYSAFEKFNMGHNHDVNTGSILIGGQVLRNAPKLNGNGCAPAWALPGGDISNTTPTKVSKTSWRKNPGEMGGMGGKRKRETTLGFSWGKDLLVTYILYNCIPRFA
jgi:hypothetical protein